MSEIPQNPNRGGAHERSAGAEAQANRSRTRNNDLARSGQAVVPLPGGIVVPISAFSGIKSLPTKDATKYLAHPEKWIVENPTPGSKYVWASRDEKFGGDMTSAAIRSQRYRPVKRTEIKDRVDFDLHFKTATGTSQFVCWRDLMLCEVSEQYAQEQYDSPIAEYLQHLGVAKEAFEAEVHEQSRGMAVGTMEARITPG